MNAGTLFGEKRFIFLAGLHRSGTSLLHEILRCHPEISGFANTGVPKDEGQHLQTVYEAAKTLGGPGQFAFNEKAYMDETHELATAQNAETLFGQWREYWDLNCKFLLEKSPPNIIRTRFLQKMFPRSLFVVIIRHPAIVALATRKWCRAGIPSLIDHTLKTYDLFFKDRTFLRDVFVLRYEHFVLEPQASVDNICGTIGVRPFPVNQMVRRDINARYFEEWEQYIQDQGSALFDDVEELERRFNTVGYSIRSQYPIVSKDGLGKSYFTCHPRAGGDP
ncbi:hypothetical protein BMS3Abin13_00184 [bacterium BMS3Abin13]|nr:hypothetical protein BMS3Abin13_00184 [bacterium BMS3Abin13]